MAERAYARTRAINERMARVLIFGAMLIFLAWLWGVTLFSVASMGMGEVPAKRLVEALLIALAGYFTWELVRLFILRKLSNELVEPLDVSEENDEGPRAGPSSRLGTILPVVSWFLQAIVVVLFGLSALSHVGFDVTALLASAGVAGLAIGFGAQSLVKDYFTGCFLLLENQLRQGDVVRLGEHSGLVEEVTLRYVRLRDYDGNVHFVPNGQITTVVNMSRGHAHAVIDVGVGYGEDLAHAMQVMRDTASRMRAASPRTRRVRRIWRSDSIFQIVR